MCVCVRVQMHICTCIYVCLHTCKNSSTCSANMSKHVCYCMLLCLCNYTYACKDVDMEVCTSAYVNINDYIYVHAKLDLHVFFVCTHVVVGMFAFQPIYECECVLHTICVCHDNPSSFEEEHEATSHWDWLQPQVEIKPHWLKLQKQNSPWTVAGLPV